MFGQQTWITIGIAVGILLVAMIVRAVWFKPSREGFQTPAVPADLVGNTEACKMMKSVLGTVKKQLDDADVLNNPAQVQLLKVTQTSLEQQIAALACP